jgi:hypothetical protein
MQGREEVVPFCGKGRDCVIVLAEMGHKIAVDRSEKPNPANAFRESSLLR